MQLDALLEHLLTGHDSTTAAYAEAQLNITSEQALHAGHAASMHPPAGTAESRNRSRITYCLATGGRPRSTAWHAQWLEYSLPTVPAGRSSSHELKSMVLGNTES